MVEKRIRTIGEKPKMKNHLYNLSVKNDRKRLYSAGAIEIDRTNDRKKSGVLGRTHTKNNPQALRVRNRLTHLKSV